MLKPIKNLLERSAYVIAIVLTTVIIYLSLVPTPKVIISVVSISDKSVHLFAYFTLSYSWFFAVKTSHLNLYSRVRIGIFILFFSIILELLQGNFTNYRTMDYFDMIANGFGIIIAIVTFERLIRFYHTI